MRQFFQISYSINTEIYIYTEKSLLTINDYPQSVPKKYFSAPNPPEIYSGQALKDAVTA